jgi:hypothetical protein
MVITERQDAKQLYQLVVLETPQPHSTIKYWVVMLEVRELRSQEQVVQLPRGVVETLAFQGDLVHHHLLQHNLAQIQQALQTMQELSVSPLVAQELGRV